MAQSPARSRPASLPCGGARKMHSGIWPRREGRHGGYSSSSSHRSRRQRSRVANVGAAILWLSLGLFALWTYYSFWRFMLGEDVMPRAVRSPEVDKDADKGFVVLVLVMQAPFEADRVLERREAIEETWATWFGSGRFTFQVRHVGKDLDSTNTNVYSCFSEHKSECLVEGYAAAANEFGIEALAHVVKVDDVTFVMPSRLLAYLSTINPADARAGGSLLCTSARQQDCFLSGGAGFFLTREAVRQLLVHWPTCSTQLNTPFHLRAEDVSIASCLRTEVGIEVFPVLDFKGDELFHVFEPATLLFKNVASWYEEYKKNAGLAVPQQCCSMQTITFHYVEPPLMKLLWRCHLDRAACPSHPTDWPRGLGGHARRPRSDTEVKIISYLIKSRT